MTFIYFILTWSIHRYMSKRFYLSTYWCCILIVLCLLKVLLFLWAISHLSSTPPLGPTGASHVQMHSSAPPPPPPQRQPPTRSCRSEMNPDSASTGQLQQRPPRPKLPPPAHKYHSEKTNNKSMSGRSSPLSKFSTNNAVKASDLTRSQLSKPPLPPPPTFMKPKPPPPPIKPDPPARPQINTNNGTFETLIIAMQLLAQLVPTKSIY